MVKHIRSTNNTNLVEYKAVTTWDWMTSSVRVFPSRSCSRGISVRSVSLQFSFLLDVEIIVWNLDMFHFDKWTFFLLEDDVISVSVEAAVQYCTLVSQPPAPPSTVHLLFKQRELFSTVLGSLRVFATVFKNAVIMASEFHSPLVVLL